MTLRDLAKNFQDCFEKLDKKSVEEEDLILFMITSTKDGQECSQLAIHGSTKNIAKAICLNMEEDEDFARIILIAAEAFQAMNKIRNMSEEKGNKKDFATLLNNLKLQN
jgi:hypothetical protein